MSRKLSRIAMMKILFAMEQRKEFSEEVMESFLENDWERAELEKIYRRIFSGEKLDEKLASDETMPLSKGDLAYLRQHVPLFLDYREGIDETIEANLKDWSIDRMAAVDLTILRLAVYEILYCPDIAPPVSINEAVNLAKMFSTADSARFINGILGSLLRDRS